MHRHEVSANSALSLWCLTIWLSNLPDRDPSLALCELHLVLAGLALRVLPNMELYKTTEDDVLYDHDMFVPVAKAGSQGVRVVMK